MTTQSTANAQYGALGICYHLIFQIQLSTLLFVGKVPLTALTIHPSVILHSQAGPGLLGLDQLPFRCSNSVTTIGTIPAKAKDVRDLF
jgi:hypothetical protein